MSILSIPGHARAGIYCLNLTGSPKKQGKAGDQVTLFVAMA